MKPWMPFLFCALILPLREANAEKPANASGTLTIIVGTGELSCGKFIEYRTQPNNENQMNLFVQWVWGYLSAYNLRGGWETRTAGSDHVTPPDSPTVLLFLEHFCDEHPLDIVANGALTLLKKLGGTEFPRILPRGLSPSEGVD
jgi:hypothetical protein